MNAQTHTQIVEPPIWSGWRNSVINGVYPLRQLVHGSEHGAVFLTERKGTPGADAALKLIPIDRVTLAQLSHWKLATGLSHPHLLQLFDAGLCQLGGRQFLFVVMEYAHETLCGVLAQRALTQEEGLELLPPTLAALSFLHNQGLVLGHLKPSNVLVVNDQLKLASDGIRPVGAPRVGIAEASIYDAPEADRLPFSEADDIWALGVMMVEALTQRLPRFERGSTAIQMPEDVPATFMDTVQRCTHHDPAARPTAAQLLAPPAPAPEPAAPAAVADPDSIAPSVPVSSRPERVAVTTAVLALALLGIGWFGLRHWRTHSPDQPGVALNAPMAARLPAVAPQIAVPQPMAPSPHTAAIQQPLPDVPRSALRTINGRIKVVVAVVVNRSGAVIETRLKSVGPSAYFANRARDAAKKWRFTPTDQSGTRQWLLRFEFTHSGISSNATAGS